MELGIDDHEKEILEVEKYKENYGQHVTRAYCRNFFLKWVSYFFIQQELRRTCKY